MKRSEAIKSHARVPTISRAHAAKGVTNTSGIYVLPQDQIRKGYEELDGAQGREVFFRPHRYSQDDLRPLAGVVVARVDGHEHRCALVDVSQSGVGMAWPLGMPFPETLELRLELGGQTLFDGEGRIASDRVVDGHRIIGLQLADHLLPVDDVLQLREIEKWRTGSGSSMAESERNWHVSGHSNFKSLVADFRLFLEDAEGELGELEAELPFDLVHGEGVSPGRDAIIAHLRETFVPDLVTTVDLIDEVLRTADAADWEGLKQFSIRHLHPFFMRSPWMHRAYHKPLGYPGDYEVMKSLYAAPFDGQTLFGKALSYAFQHTRAPWAVRARKDMVKRELRGLVENWKENRPIRILSVAAGPAQEVFELLNDMDDVPVPVDIILFDQDSGALAYGYGRLRRLVDTRWKGRVKITFLHDSIKRLVKDPEIFREFGTFDAIVSAGLYDYLRESTAVALTRQLYDRLNGGGSVYVGNMAPENPSRWFMEHHLDWFLIHRTRDAMRTFAAAAAPRAQIAILEEASGVNPFVRVTKV